jgi:hypothetical protein
MFYLKSLLGASGMQTQHYSDNLLSILLFAIYYVALSFQWLMTQIGLIGLISVELQYNNQFSITARNYMKFFNNECDDTKA